MRTQIKYPFARGNDISLHRLKIGGHIFMNLNPLPAVEAVRKLNTFNRITYSGGPQRLEVNIFDYVFPHNPFTEHLTDFVDFLFQFACESSLSRFKYSLVIIQKTDISK